MVDVREHDFKRVQVLKIKGAMHYTVSRVRQDVAPLVKALRNQRVVVFHCMYSQQRGPSCADRYIEYRRKHPQDGPEQLVLVLRGGFHNFHKEYKDDAQLFERAI